MKRSVWSLAFVSVCWLAAQPAIGQTADEKCRSKLRLALEDLQGDAIRRAAVGKGDVVGPQPALVYEDALKALDDPHHKIIYRQRLRDFSDLVVKAMHNPSCDDYAIKTLNALIER